MADASNELMAEALLWCKLDLVRTKAFLPRTLAENGNADQWDTLPCPLFCKGNRYFQRTSTRWEVASIRRY